jgi:DNA-binding LytR/AlgR family response regulator
MKHSYIIIDAFKEDVINLKESLECFKDYTCLGTASNENQAIDLILNQNPDLVFLEVEVPGNHYNMSIFSVITELTKYTDNLPAFVVTTATKAYALDAIKNDVLDYILKPLNSIQLKRVLMRFEKKQADKPQMLCIKSHGDHKFVNLEEVLYLQADNNTTDLYLIDGSKVSAFKTLKHFESIMPNYFTRIHNSYIINTKHVTRINFGKNRFAMQNSVNTIPFSKSYKDIVESIKTKLVFNNAIYV